jgi:hypothetical protein
MEEKICTHKSTDCELESIDTLEKYYSVEFSLNSKGPAYIFRLRDISLDCLKQLKVGDILNMEYNSPKSLVPTKLLKTQIISKNYHDRFTGHSLVGLSIVDKQDGRL